MRKVLGLFLLTVAIVAAHESELHVPLQTSNNDTVTPAVFPMPDDTVMPTLAEVDDDDAVEDADEDTDSMEMGLLGDDNDDDDRDDRNERSSRRRPLLCRGRSQTRRCFCRRFPRHFKCSRFCLRNPRIRRCRFP